MAGRGHECLGTVDSILCGLPIRNKRHIRLALPYAHVRHAAPEVSPALKERKIFIVSFVHLLTRPFNCDQFDIRNGCLAVNSIVDISTSHICRKDQSRRRTLSN